MLIDQLQNEIRGFCEQNADQALVTKYQRYFVEGYDAFGVDGKLMEQQRAAWLAQYRAQLGLAGFLDLGDRLVATGKYEEASFALGFARAFEKEFAPHTLERLGNWLERGIGNWAHTDSFSLDLLALFITRRIVPLQAISTWRQSPSRWKRRSVPVSLIKTLKMDFDIVELLQFLAPLMNDPEKVVQQGLGWFLREAWKQYPAGVEAYLLEWKETCGRIVVQYATEKMTLEQKARFKRAKR